MCVSLCRKVDFRIIWKCPFLYWCCGISYEVYIFLSSFLSNVFLPQFIDYFSLCLMHLLHEYRELNLWTNWMKHFLSFWHTTVHKKSIFLFFSQISFFFIFFSLLNEIRKMSVSREGWNYCHFFVCLILPWKGVFICKNGNDKEMKNNA